MVHPHVDGQAENDGSSTMILRVFSKSDNYPAPIQTHLHTHLTCSILCFNPIFELKLEGYNEWNSRYFFKNSRIQFDFCSSHTQWLLFHILELISMLECVHQERCQQIWTKFLTGTAFRIDFLFLICEIIFYVVIVIVVQCIDCIACNEVFLFFVMQKNAFIFLSIWFWVRWHYYYYLLISNMKYII